jgi:hypothetical protein
MMLMQFELVQVNHGGGDNIGNMVPGTWCASSALTSFPLELELRLQRP